MYYVVTYPLHKNITIWEDHDPVDTKIYFVETTVYTDKTMTFCESASRHLLECCNEAIVKFTGKTDTLEQARHLSLFEALVL